MGNDQGSDHAGESSGDNNFFVENEQFFGDGHNCSQTEGWPPTPVVQNVTAVSEKTGFVTEAVRVTGITCTRFQKMKLTDANR